MASFTKNISQEDQQKALKSSKLLAKQKIRKNQKVVNFKLVNSGEILSIPIQAFELLEKALEQMAIGNTLTLVENEKLISTQKAAEILNVSRPHIVKLLENGTIPFEKVGTHRRIKIADIIKYKEQLIKVRKKALSSLTNQAQKLKMGY